MTAFFRKSARAVLMILLLTSAWAMAAQAQTAELSVRLADHLHPQSEEDARILLDGVEKAAVEVCGAFNSSLVEYRRSIRRSSCWQKSVSDTVARIGSPILSEAYSRKLAESR